jgi:hypothetical protein
MILRTWGAALLRPYAEARRAKTHTQSGHGGTRTLRRQQEKDVEVGFLAMVWGNSYNEVLARGRGMSRKKTQEGGASHRPYKG